MKNALLKIGVRQKLTPYSIKKIKVGGVEYGGVEKQRTLDFMLVSRIVESRKSKQNKKE